jgi:hypothetical protein
MCRASLTGEEDVALGLFGRPTVDLRIVEFADEIGPDDLPCPWCHTPTAADDDRCPGCNRRFG